jgi:competence protein ComEC
MDSGATSSTGTFLELQNEIVNKNITKEISFSGEIIDLGGGVYLKILYPESELKSKDTNDNSIIAKLYYGDSVFLFTGDAPSDVEQYLAMTKSEELDSHVLKVAHHGSKNSLSDEFVSAVSPEYSVISAGLNNQFGHPHQEIIDSLNNIGTEILKTFEMGDIIFTSDGENIRIKDK